MNIMLSLVLGAFGWSISEYAIHRFIGHGPKRRPVRGLRLLTPSGIAAAFNEEHLLHHANPQYFAPASKKVVAAFVVSGALTILSVGFVGIACALAFSIGFAGAYASYEYVHRRVHTHAPRGRFGRWARRHHLAHHYRSPRVNHGVTSWIWDRVFGTYAPIALGQKVRIARRAAPLWLLQPTTGEIDPRYAHEYELVGGHRASLASEPDDLSPGIGGVI